LSVNTVPVLSERKKVPRSVVRIRSTLHARESVNLRVGDDAATGGFVGTLQVRPIRPDAERSLTIVMYALKDNRNKSTLLFWPRLL
jgi:hypothetical protein